MFDISILKNTIEGMASDADDNGEKDFAIRLTVEDAFALCRLEPVRHGYWIDDGVWNVCSVCGRAFLKVHLNGNPTFNYCPNCGAKMDEVSE